MRDLLDRAFFLNLQSAVRGVIDRRDEIAASEPMEVVPELIDALESYRQGAYETVIKIAKDVLERVDALPGASAAYAASILSRSYASRGLVNEGLELFESGRLAGHFTTPLAASTYSWLYAHFLRAESRFLEAKDVLQRAHMLVLESTEPKNAFRIVSDRATVHLALGDEALAITLYERAITEFEDDPDYAIALVRTRCNLASAYQRVARDKDALKVYDELLSNGSLDNEFNTFIVVKLNKAIALKALNRLDEAFEAYSEVLTLSRERDNTQFEIRALIGLSNLRRQQDRRDESITFARLAQKVAKERNSRPLLIESKQRIADIEQDNGNTAAAAEILRECFVQLVETGDYHEAIKVGDKLVELYQEMELFKEALDVSQECAHIQRTAHEGEIERSLEIASVRERYAKEKESARIRDEERTKVLHAVMPAHIAARLTAGERQIVDTLPAVTIMFADVVGFTELVSSMSGESLLELLSTFFAGMDAAASRFGCERIKTVGDSYMAICGASEECADHAERVVRMALAVINGEVPLPIDPSRLRIGINTGPVIAGVMDGQRISYDVWGDTVNVAARMEEYSLPGRVNCTAAVAECVKHVPEFRLIQREPLTIHGKGLMTTYWIESDQGSTI